MFEGMQCVDGEPVIGILQRMLKNRHYAFLVPWFMDGSLSMVVLAVPLLALKFGASALMLGALGWIPQIVRLPLCLTAGHLSERFGRKVIVALAAVAMIVGSLGIVFAQTSWQILLPYTLVIAGSAAFYPPLQAWIGDLSGFGELTKNLGWFNLGWCTGAAIAAWIAALIVTSGLDTVLFTATGWATLSLILLLSWRPRDHNSVKTQIEDSNSRPDYPSHILLIARLATFTGFLGIIAAKTLFPKLAESWKWTDAQIATVLATEVAGMAVSIIVCNVSPWWRGKVWPHAAAQLVYVVCGALIVVATSPVVCGIALFVIGAAVGVAYTAALYHGLSGGKDRGRSTGIHEGIVASSAISAGLLGGWAAQIFSLRAPYVIFSVVSAICLIVTISLPLRARSVRA